MSNRGTKTRVLVRLAACCLLAAANAATPALAQEALTVGEHHEIRIDSRGPSDVVPVTTASGVRYTMHHPGASYIALHFADFDLAPGERVVVSDAGGGQGYTLTGRGKMGAGAFWAQHVKGDTIVVELVRAGEAPDRGFTIDGYAAGFVDLGGTGTDAICGTNDKRNAVRRRATWSPTSTASRARPRRSTPTTSSWPRRRAATTATASCAGPVRFSPGRPSSRTARRSITRWCRSPPATRRRPTAS